MKPKVFIGSSTEALPIANAIHQNIAFQAQVTVWDQGIFELSRPNLESLVAAPPEFDFAIFVFSPDDLVTMRAEEHRAVRDNVLFELGLFIGELGQKRCFILVPDGPTRLHLPTDLLGFEPATYEADRTDKKWRPATGPACTNILHQLEVQGPRSIVEDRAEGTSPTSNSSDGTPKKLEVTTNEERQLTKEEQALDPWLVAMIEGRLGDALREIAVALSNENSAEKIFNLELWQALITFEQSADYGEACHRRLAHSHPEKHQPWGQLSSALLHAGFRDRALAIVEEGLTLLPNDPDLFIAKAHCLEALQRIDEAEFLLSSQLESNGSNREELFLQLARLQIRQGKATEALLELNRGLTVFPYHVAFSRQKRDFSPPTMIIREPLLPIGS